MRLPPSGFGRITTSATNAWVLLVEVLRQTLVRSHMNARPDPAQAPTPRLASDFQRLLFSAATGAAATAAAEGLYLAISGSGLSAVAIVVAAYIFSATSSLVYFITSFAIFQNADADSLARWVAATAPTGRLSRVQAEFAGTGPTITVQWSGHGSYAAKTEPNRGCLALAVASGFLGLFHSSSKHLRRRRPSRTEARPPTRSGFRLPDTHAGIGKPGADDASPALSDREASACCI
jgi:hypothetical protein